MTTSEGEDLDSLVSSGSDDERDSYSDDCDGGSSASSLPSLSREASLDMATTGATVKSEFQAAGYLTKGREFEIKPHISFIICNLLLIKAFVQWLI